MDRDQFAVAVAGILTDEQREQIRQLHDQVLEGTLDGCSAHGEGVDCCVDMLVGSSEADAFRSAGAAQS